MGNKGTGVESLCEDGRANRLRLGEDLVKEVFVGSKILVLVARHGCGCEDVSFTAASSKVAVTKGDSV